MSDPGAERQTRTQVLRPLLYPVIFSPDLSREVDRVCQLFRTRPHDEVVRLIQGTRAELAQPMLQVTGLESLVSKPTENEARAYLTAVVQQMEADLVLRGGA